MEETTVSLQVGMKTKVKKVIFEGRAVGYVATTPRIEFEEYECAYFKYWTVWTEDYHGGGIGDGDPSNLGDGYELGNLEAGSRKEAEEVVIRDHKRHEFTWAIPPLGLPEGEDIEDDFREALWDDALDQDALWEAFRGRAPIPAWHIEALNRARAEGHVHAVGERRSRRQRPEPDGPP